MVLIAVVAVPASASAASNTASVSGTVRYFDETDGQIKPAAGVGVGALWGISKEWGPIDGGWDTAVTDASGAFTISGLPAGEFTLSFGGGPQRYNSHAAYLGNAITPAGADYFVLAEGGSTTVTYTLPRGDELKKLSGYLVNDQGQPQPGAVIVFSGGTTDNSGAIVRLFLVGANGRYDIWLQTGYEYRVAFTANQSNPMGGNHVNDSDGYYASFSGGVYSYSEAGPIVPGPESENATVVLHPKPFGTALGGTYVALGDSYQSGEGAGSYFPETDSDTNKCHRSRNAYPEQLNSWVVAYLDLEFRACSGAKFEDLYEAFDAGGPPWDDGVRQVDALDSSTRLVTIGIGGNDLGFASIVTVCVLSLDSCQSLKYPPCALALVCPTVSQVMDSKVESLMSGELQDQLVGLLRDITNRAPNASVYLVSYPRFFTEHPFTLCNWIDPHEQVWINAGIDRAALAYARAAAIAGVEFVNMAGATEGHEVCSDEPQMHGLVNLVEAFHPNAEGHQSLANELVNRFGDARPTFDIYPGQSVEREFVVSGENLHVSVKWPGSDVETSIVSPSGRVYSRADFEGAVHEQGGTWEYYGVANPEPGTWHIVSYGLDVSTLGEPVTLTLVDEPIPNELPTSVISFSGAGATYQFDAVGSTDVDGSIAEYLWDFGDGEIAYGASVEHTYAGPGVYTVALVTTDDDGGKGFAAVNQAIEVPEVDPEPEPAAVALLSASSLSLTNAFRIESGDVHVNGDFECNSSVSIAGDVVVAGNVHLTNQCTLGGDLWAGGNVSVDSTPSVAGSIYSAGNVRMQSSVHVGGDIVAAGIFTSIDGRSIETLQLLGAVGGLVRTGETIPMPDVTTFLPADAFEPEPGASELTWREWMNSIAVSHNAPSWSQGRSANPGCTMAPWAASVNTSTVDIDSPVSIDARHTTSSCSAIALQGMTLRLSADLTIRADQFNSINGLKVTSADGLPHHLKVLVTGSASCGSARSIALSSQTDIDPLIATTLHAPGRVTIHGTSSVRGVIESGCFSASGSVTTGRG